MAYALFNEGEYKYLDRGDNVLFIGDKKHIKLLDYINADLSFIPDLLLQHCFDRMNLYNFELLSCKKNENELTQIKAIMKSVHPYYEYEFNKTIFNAIAEYFNDLLLYIVYYCDRTELIESINESWYKERLRVLMPAFIPEKGEKGPDEFFKEYKDKTDKLNVAEISEDPSESVVPTTRPVPFSSEIRAQKKIANMLYFLLDIDAKYINELSLQQRAWLYRNIFNTNLNITANMSFLEQTVFESGINRSQETNESIKLRDVFDPLYSLINIDVMHYGIPGEIQDKFSTAVRLAKETAFSGLNKKYKIDSLQQLLVIEIVCMIEDQTMIRVCKNCGKYFIISDRKMAYCDRTDEYGRKCSDVGRARTFKKKMDNDELLMLYNRAYKRYYARRKSGRISEYELEYWRKKAKENLDKVRNGEYDLEEYKQWLGKKS